MTTKKKRRILSRQRAKTTTHNERSTNDKVGAEMMVESAMTDDDEASKDAQFGMYLYGFGREFFAELVWSRRSRNLYANVV